MEEVIKLSNILYKLSDILCNNIPEICIIISIFMFALGKFMKVDYMDFSKIISNHVNFLRNKSNNIVILPFVNYFIIPAIISIGLVVKKTIGEDEINTITIIISIFTSMFFVLFTMIVPLKEWIKSLKDVSSSDYRNLNQLIKETYNAIMFEILICMVLLLLCFLSIFKDTYGVLLSFMIYYLIFTLIFNMLIVLKRIYGLVEKILK